jgi:hypothetical protein
MPAVATNDGTTSSHRDGHYSGLPNKLVRAANGFLFQHHAEFAADVEAFLSDPR